MQLLNASKKHRFEIIAYTLMPDHIHGLLEGMRNDSDFISWLDLWRQLSGFWEKRRSGPARGLPIFRFAAIHAVRDCRNDACQTGDRRSLQD